jgi:acetolactate synthase-1/2/3 large subunit
MTGAESLIRTACAAGIEICFANPGTTEVPFVEAFDRVGKLRTVLGLFEGVCTGAADGYARMAGKPALTLLHLGPGFANGIAYLHDARRARSPMVNLIGDHATWHIAADPPLNSDIESLARPVSAWLRKSASAAALANDVAEAIAFASVAPGRIATLIAPHDYQMGEAAHTVAPLPVAAPPTVSEAAVRAAYELLRKDKTALLVGGMATSARGLRAASRIAAATGCRLLCENFPARLERGGGLPGVTRVPYFPEPAQALFGQFNGFVLAGAKSPVTFFGYPGVRSYVIAPEQSTVTLATPDEDSVRALEALADALNAPPFAPLPSPAPTAKPTGALTLESFAAAISLLQPEDAIIMDEGITSSGHYDKQSLGAPPHSYLTQPGGAIGLGLPCATGAAVACPDRPVINIQADGSAMYTLQSLWTQARESLNVTTIICNNRSYRIIGVELRRAGIEEVGQQAQSLMSLANPPLDWVQLAAGMGVPGARVETTDELVIQLERALAEPGPHLIEAML